MSHGQQEMTREILKVQFVPFWIVENSPVDGAYQDLGDVRLVARVCVTERGEEMLEVTQTTQWERGRLASLAGEGGEEGSRREEQELLT